MQAGRARHIQAMCLWTITRVEVMELISNLSRELWSNHSSTLTLMIAMLAKKTKQVINKLVSQHDFIAIS